jgi:hypothetical protein
MHCLLHGFYGEYSECPHCSTLHDVALILESAASPNKTGLLMDIWKRFRQEQAAREEQLKRLAAQQDEIARDNLGVLKDTLQKERLYSDQLCQQLRTTERELQNVKDENMHLRDGILELKKALADRQTEPVDIRNQALGDPEHDQYEYEPRKFVKKAGR